MVTPQPTSETDANQATRRLRRRNHAMLAVLLGLIAIIFAVTIVKGRR